MTRAILSFALAGVVLVAPVHAQTPAATVVRQPEATSLLGTPLFPPVPIPNEAKLLDDLRLAQSVANTTTPEAIIWIGRRQAYLWRYAAAIATFTDGIRRYPDDARMYRHRGHRYITTRQFDKARADFERAAALIRNTADSIEPDGAPNPAGQPRSTLHFNIWYHLGLTYYLQGDFAKALDAYTQCMAVSTNDDSIVATSDWMWMTLMRLGRKDEAARVLARITPRMDILENGSYHRRLLMYKGLDTPDALLDPAGADATTIATQGYGVGNYYLVMGDRERARRTFTQVIAGSGWNAFGYIAAEADLARMR
ncbi:MAG: tetratricopeptide repeat protein [Acidobacteria bacterium]|nr:tetratricopeptide repeat protein [Acidobacteriota bacterium]